ncbi:MAG: adenosylcobinamide-GDP ribazoletransferase [Desulfobacterales bacterium]|nr:adenosylcobinamide-GDP ribazoletransferase [Desulfobacterales bacterium]
MKNLISALQFITILPLGKVESYDPLKMVPYFPLAGFLLGLLVALFDSVVIRFWTPPVAALLDVAFLAVLTGAFHLDGLGDTADGLLGPRSRDTALEIMKDSRLGTMGLVAILFGLALKWGGIASLNAHRSILLIMVPAYARAGILFGMRYLPYGRSDGTGKPFFSESISLKHFWGLIFPISLSLILGLDAIWLNLAFAIIIGTILLFYKKRMGCITGDMLGAMVEITEAGLLLMISLGDAL